MSNALFTYTIRGFPLHCFINLLYIVISNLICHSLLAGDHHGKTFYGIPLVEGKKIECDG